MDGQLASACWPAGRPNAGMALCESARSSAALPSPPRQHARLAQSTPSPTTYFPPLHPAGMPAFCSLERRVVQKVRRPRHHCCSGVVCVHLPPPRPRSCSASTAASERPAVETPFTLPVSLCALTLACHPGNAPYSPLAQSWCSPTPPKVRHCTQLHLGARLCSSTHYNLPAFGALSLAAWSPCHAHWQLQCRPHAIPGLTFRAHLPHPGPRRTAMQGALVLMRRRWRCWSAPPTPTCSTSLKTPPTRGCTTPPPVPSEWLVSERLGRPGSHIHMQMWPERCQSASCRVGSHHTKRGRLHGPPTAPPCKARL